MDDWRRTAASGLIVLVPILICAYIITFVYTLIVHLPILDSVHPPVLRVVLILFICGLCILSVGYLMRTTLGRFLDQRFDALVNRFPGIRTIHGGLKRAVRTAVMHQDAVREPVKIQVWHDHHMSGIRTGNWTDDGREIIYIPGSPDITAGFLAEIEPENIVETDETLLEVLVRLISLGFGDSAENTAETSYTELVDDQ